ncbi:MAG: hypothetical protein V7L27_01965 [Nostoc sp.]|uniref:hypothetical protein n=1 Tax=Nostoc sp. TaxID=1180 RepID=UPI002FF733D6
MSQQNFLNESDIDTLTNLLLRSQQSRTREALCSSIRIDPRQLSFLRNSSDSDFFLLLIGYLNEIGDQEALCRLCCRELFPIFNKSAHRTILEDIAVKLNCNHESGHNSPKNKTVGQSTSPIHSSVPEFRVNYPNQLDESKPESLFTKIGNFNKNLLTVGAIILIGLGGYPTYKHFKQPSQLEEDQALTQKAQPVQSEIEGSIGEHKKGGVLVKRITKVDLRNFIVEAQFDNPYDGTIMDNWTYGFAFIDNTTPLLNDPKRKGFDAWVDSKNKTWGFSSDNISLNGNLSNLNVSDKSSNKLRLTVNNKKAKFFVNDMYIGTFDISELTNKGSVFLTAGGGISDKSVQYQYKNLRVWSLDN